MNNRSVEAINIAASGIKIISENMDNTPDFQMARRCLQQAERIFFFGFGYHPTNLRRLGLASNLNARPVTGYISGTWQGMTPTERDKLERRYGFFDFETTGAAANIMGLMRHANMFLDVIE